VEVSYDYYIMPKNTLCARCGEHPRQGTQSYCRECRNAFNRANYAKHADAIKRRVAEWTKAHPDLRRATMRRYYEKNREAVRAYTRAWAKAHPEQVRATHASWRKKHPDRVEQHRINHWRNKLKRLDEANDGDK
jgi:hypothetical protein